jgi:hypothetical protein
VDLEFNICYEQNPKKIRIGGNEIFSHFLPGDEVFENRGKNELKNSIGAAIFSIRGV